MISQVRDQQWRSILNLTEKMLDASNEEEWDALVSFEAQRGKLLSVFFAKAVSLSEAQAIRNGIAEIMTTDKKICGLSASAHFKIGEKLNKLATHKNASSAYLKNTG
ncbi:MAG: flagellar protein FliT [Gammaproteobacteria bacterium]|nr:flagellar protein FliT [Gammaproteobacteria bacterium]